MSSSKANESKDVKPVIPNATPDPGAASGQPWQRPTGGAWALVALCVLALVGLVLAAGRVWEPDELGEDDAGVVHPQPLGVDDDVAPRYGND